jgi:predicted phage-related endonuclease
MNVLDRPYCYFATLIGGHKFIYKRIERDQAVIDQVQEMLVSWWRDHIEKDVAPDVDGSDWTRKTLQAIYPDNHVEVELPSEFHQLLDLRKQIADQEVELKAQKNQIENQVREAMGNGDTAELGQYRITYRTNKRGVRPLKIKEVASNGN